MLSAAAWAGPAIVGAGVLGAALWPTRARSRRDIPPGRRVVEYWEKWTGDEASAARRMVDRFNASQDRWWVRTTAVSDIKTKTLVAIGGGDPPDVAGLFCFNVPLLAESGAVDPVDEIVGSVAYKPAVRRLLSHEGRAWAGVSTCSTVALYVNRSAWDESGLAGVPLPRTVSELDAAAERMTRSGPGGELGRVGFLPNLPLWWPYFWPVAFGGVLYDEAAARAVLTDAGAVAAYEWVGAWGRRLGRERAQRFAASYARAYLTAEDPFFRGRAAMVVQGPWLAAFAARHAPGLRYEVAPMPGVEIGASRALVEADVLVLPRGGREPEGARAFLAFSQRSEELEALARAHAKPSPLEAVSPTFEAGHPNPFVGVHDELARRSDAAVLPRLRVWQAYSDLTISAFQRVWEGEAPGPVLRETEARAQELIDAARRLRDRRRARA